MMTSLRDLKVQINETIGSNEAHMVFHLINKSDHSHCETGHPDIVDQKCAAIKHIRIANK